MSDESEPEHTHRVVHGSHVRLNEGNPKRTYEPGEPITPTESELAAFPDRFEPLDTPPTEQAESAAEDDAEVGMGDESDESEDAESGDESADTSGEDEGLTAETVEAAEYADLRSLAGEFDDVNGNWGEDRLRAELLDRVSED